jgi:hypothetical protein
VVRPLDRGGMDERRISMTEVEWTTGKVGDGPYRVDFERIVEGPNRGWWKISAHDGRHFYRAWDMDVAGIAAEASELSALLADLWRKDRQSDLALHEVEKFIKETGERHRTAYLEAGPHPEYLFADPVVESEA